MPINHPVMMSPKRTKLLFDWLVRESTRLDLVQSARDHRKKIEQQGQSLARMGIEGQAGDQDFILIRDARKMNIIRLGLITERLEKF